MAKSDTWVAKYNVRWLCQIDGWLRRYFVAMTEKCVGRELGGLVER